MKVRMSNLIKEVRLMTKEEAEEEGWDFEYQTIPPVIVLADDTIIYPSADPEGNGPGMLFGKTKDGNSFYYYPEDK
jgi:hypothetical protein